MRVRRLTLRNFRGVSDGVVEFSGHTLLVGGNNVGKSTVCEALDLVLGPERLYRRPPVDEHDFYRSDYLDVLGDPDEIHLTAVLVDLSDEARRRFFNHLRPWSEAKGDFIDDGETAAEEGTTTWALSVTFLGRYDPVEDDFVGGTFFTHPKDALQIDEDEAEVRLGAGMKPFTREHKRLCGFVFLRTLRTGNRALSLQRGSLLDTVLRLGGTGLAEMWQETLTRLKTLDPPIGDIAQLSAIRKSVRERLAKFVNLAPGDDAIAFFASDLTRENLREVVRLFIAAQPGDHAVPFARLGTGSVNLLVFALLTIIADLKDKQSVIFAMEEPEIALPPHTQRRVTRFVLSEMGQTIVTSHSPYVIEQFEPEQIVMLDRTEAGKLTGQPLDIGGVKPKTFKTDRRQFAEAVLSRAVLVVEGATEASLFPVAASVLEQSAPGYTHLDLAGVTIFDARSDTGVPRFGPVFAALNKVAFAFHDEPNKPFDAVVQAKMKLYHTAWKSPEKGIENVLAKQIAEAALRRFLAEVAERDDYPHHLDAYVPSMSEGQVRKLACDVLKARKGDAYGYAAAAIGQCATSAELPQTIKQILLAIDQALTPKADDDLI